MRVLVSAAAVGLVREAFDGNWPDDRRRPLSELVQRQLVQLGGFIVDVAAGADRLDFCDIGVARRIVALFGRSRLRGTRLGNRRRQY